MKNKTKTLLIGLFVIIIAIIIGIRTYNKPHVNVTKTEAKYNLESQQLINSFLADEDKASKKYVNTIIQVSGEVSEVNNGTISLKDNNAESAIQCNFKLDENIKLKKIKQGDKIKVKGICTGYLLDVVLVDCVLVNN